MTTETAAKPHSPQWPLIIAIALMLVSFIPSQFLQLTLWAFLAAPFDGLYRPPLVYGDAPWILTYFGGIVTAAAWSLGLLGIAKLFRSTKRS